MNYDVEKVILTDCDGVLLNWEYALDVFMAARGYKMIENGRKHYDCAVRYNLTPKERKALIREFNNSAVMGFLPPLRDALHYVRKLHEEHGFVFHVITSMSIDPFATKLRKQNLRKLFGETVFEGFTFLDTGLNKDEALEPYRDSGLIWVEDKLENAVLGHELGLNSMIMEHGHTMRELNEHRDDDMWQRSLDIPRYATWKEIYEAIT